MTGNELLARINSPKALELFSSFYGKDEAEAARLRYSSLVEGLLQDGPGGFPRSEFSELAGELRGFSVPGRTELGGNHTDHNRGKVLAGSIQLDAVAVAAARSDKQVFFRSAGHSDVKLDLLDLSRREDETGTTAALIRGIAAELNAQGTPVNGFTANAGNMVLTGSGLSSSAAVEVLIAKIFDNLYCGGKRSSMDLAKIGQKAENVYFGKPCGLMDQAACATGGVIAIDFGDPEKPLVRRIDFDPAAAGFALCVVNTRGTHADLTPDYAAVPFEMKQAAAFFGKTVLRELDEATFMSRLADLRKNAGDRAVLRAFHFFSENRRVEAMLKTLEEMNAASPEKKGPLMDAFLVLVRESGDSSWELLQNVYSPKNPSEQGVSLAQALTRNFLKAAGLSGVCRVHGGGFAGTIQAYLPLGKLEEYHCLMEGIFGEGALTVLRIRPLGAAELDF
jgi:galactokinase